MIMYKGILNQCLGLLIFSVVFIFCSLIFENSLNSLNQEKSKFPILVYSDNLHKLNDIAVISQNNVAFDYYQIVSPDSLKTILFGKYDFEDLYEIANDFVLPYQLVIYVKPVEFSDLMLLVLDIGENSPEKIMQYNEEVWKEIDLSVKRLKKISFLVQTILLFIYLIIGIFLRITFIFKHKQFINAIINSGIPSRTLTKISIMNKLIFFLFSLIIIILVNFFILYLKLVDYFITDNSVSLYYLNIEIIIKLLITNAILVIIQRPLFKREKNA